MLKRQALDTEMLVSVVSCSFSHTLLDTLDIAAVALPMRLPISASRDQLLEIVEPR